MELVISKELRDFRPVMVLFFGTALNPLLHMSLFLSARTFKKGNRGSYIALKNKNIADSGDINKQSRSEKKNHDLLLTNATFLAFYNGF